ncbi:drug/metabolite exporter YedA [Thermomonas carbonis]|uniref:Drug/metabolite exporter YedA n=1 Tax=Thermomonas carbonis TaxID=1463158 RepID=A0A7G9STS2_9GAMM|nr:drug/metabolite exporter YedA [Thermomonas carbonis]QNN71247.1 drug/metabolite exporter YedA [Thermomonas carbonis]GHC10917.1 drug/metabolite exporter YedA [Thermomonas carbonis]
MHTTSSAATPTGGRIALALAAVYVIWGSTYLAIRFALEGGFPPFLLGGIRFTIAGALMYALLRWRGMPAPTRAQWGNAVVLGILLMLLGNGMVNLAEQTVSSGMAAVAVASAPLWMGIFAAMRGDRPTRGEWVGLGIGFIGVLWLNAGSSLSATPMGMLALLVATLAWSFGSIWSRGRDLAPPFMNAAAQMLCGGVAMIVVGLLSGERMQALPTPHALGAFAYLIVFGSWIGFTAYIWLLHHVRPALAGSYAYVNPAIAVLLGAWLAGERFGTHELVAMGVILLGVVAITFAKAFKAASR